MRLIYIVGMGRSGSTLLDLLLDTHSNVRSLGGVRRLARALPRPCACGVSARAACDFWEGIEAEVRRRLGIGLAELDVHARDDATFGAHNTALFEAAAHVAGVDCVVDSSKSVARLKRLLETTELDVRPIHIVRDPRGYTYSQRKRKRKHEHVLPAFSYVGRSLRACWVLRGRPHTVVDYAHLATDAEGCLRQLMPRLDLRFEPGQMRWAEAEHHNVGGGAMLNRAEGNAIRLDESWRCAQPSATQKVIQAITWPGRTANRAKAERWGLEVE